MTIKAEKKVSKVLSWTNYLKLVDQLYKKIDWEKEHFDSIIAINRGGNIVGTILSHKTRLNLAVLQKESVINVRGKILIIDDISDSGATLLKVISNIKPGTKYKTATLQMKPETRFVPDYYVNVEDKWVVYPYEETI